MHMSKRKVLGLLVIAVGSLLGMRSVGAQPASPDGEKVRNFMQRCINQRGAEVIKRSDTSFAIKCDGFLAKEFINYLDQYNSGKDTGVVRNDPEDPENNVGRTT